MNVHKNVRLTPPIERPRSGERMGAIGNHSKTGR
jgi:hypothetical protein